MSYFAAVLIAAVSLLGLSACKSQGSQTEAPATTAQDQNQTSAPAAETTETSSAPAAGMEAAPAAPAQPAAPSKKQ